MKIELRSRLLPFCHLPGVECVVPFSEYSIQIYPVLLRIQSLRDNKTMEEIPLNVTGPVKNFVVIQDLEKGEIGVFGETPFGLLRYTIFSLDGQLYIIVKKQPQERLLTKTSSRLLESTSKSMQASPSERLHLGMHKALDWELVKRRIDLREIFPVWHRLGQLTLEEAYIKDHSLFQECYDAVNNRKKEKISHAFHALFSAGFQGILVPRLQDSEHQGYKLPPLEKNKALTILYEGSKLIRSLFLDVDYNHIELPPVLPSEFVSGKLCNFKFPNGCIDFEWSKRIPRRMVFKALTSNTSTIIFPKNIRKARLRLNDNDKGVMVSSKALLDFEQGTHYYFDQFAH